MYEDEYDVAKKFKFDTAACPDQPVVRLFISDSSWHAFDWCLKSTFTKLLLCIPDSEAYYVLVLDAGCWADIRHLSYMSVT